jgi:type IV pilus assembly protein PilO
MAIQLSKQQQQYLGGGMVLFVVGAVVYVQFFWLPITQKKEELTTQIQEIESKISKAEAQASRLKRLQDELATLNQQAAEAERRLPKTKSVPDVLNSLNTIGVKYDVSIQSFAPGVQTTKQYFIELNYPMTVRGHYHDIGRFLAAIALEERIFNVKDIIFPTPGGDGTMVVNFTLVTYQYKG